MKHKTTGRKFSRLKGQRTALLKTLLGSLIMKEKITTTEAKAKELKMLVDKFVIKAKKMQIDETKKVAIIRDLRKGLPLMAVKKLSGEFVKKFEKRQSGFTRVIKLGQRMSDSAKMAVIEFV
jgi:large subunit ribosomal protein L17